jgi:hypothetical protein
MQIKKKFQEGKWNCEIKRIRRLFSGLPNASLTRRKSEFENLE